MCLAPVRNYLAPHSVSFSEDVAIAKPAVKGDAPSFLDTWKAKGEHTSQLLKLLQTYKDLGDAKNEVRASGHGVRGHQACDHDAGCAALCSSKAHTCLTSSCVSLYAEIAGIVRACIARSRTSNSTTRAHSRTCPSRFPTSAR